MKKNKKKFTTKNKVRFKIAEVIRLADLPEPPIGQTVYNMPCWRCRTDPSDNSMTVNLEENTYLCPRCCNSGDALDMYGSIFMLPRRKVPNAILKARKNPESRYDKGFWDKFFAIEDAYYEFLCRATGISMDEEGYGYDAV